MKRFNEKVVFLTGAASGLAKKSAQEFASEGAKVVIFDIDKENGLRVESDIKEAGGEVLFIEGDVRNSESVESGVNIAFEKYGTVDFLIHSAGILKDGMIHKLSEEDWNDVINTHLKGFFLSLQACAKRWITHCKENPKEEISEYPDKRVITISSQAAEGNI
ncbi:MAG: SDR family NAD(P)-dependent oxidoreductase, partial [Promethearchaeota archaeon]